MSPTKSGWVSTTCEAVTKWGCVRRTGLASLGLGLTTFGPGSTACLARCDNFRAKSARVGGSARPDSGQDSFDQIQGAFAQFVQTRPDCFPRPPPAPRARCASRAILCPQRAWRAAGTEAFLRAPRQMLGEDMRCRRSGHGAGEARNDEEQPVTQ